MYICSKFVQIYHDHVLRTYIATPKLGGISNLWALRTVSPWSPLAWTTSVHSFWWTAWPSLWPIAAARWAPCARRCGPQGRWDPLPPRGARPTPPRRCPRLTPRTVFASTSRIRGGGWSWATARVRSSPTDARSRPGCRCRSVPRFLQPPKPAVLEVQGAEIWFRSNFSSA